MLDLGWTEILLIAVITLIVVGPKELPNVLRTVSYWIRRARGLARDFQKGVDDIVREAELDDIKKELKDVSSGDMGARIEKAVDPTGEIKDAFKLDKPDNSADSKKPATSGAAKPETDPPKIESSSETSADAPPAAGAATRDKATAEGASPESPDGGDTTPSAPKSRASA